MRNDSKVEVYQADIYRYLLEREAVVSIVKNALDELMQLSVTEEVRMDVVRKVYCICDERSLLQETFF